MRSSLAGLALAVGAVLSGVWALLGSDALQVKAAPARPALHAVVVLVPVGNSGASGMLHFAQQGSRVDVTGTVRGLTPGKHGFHVHQFGGLTDTAKGESAGGHYNPTRMPHGAPEGARRHVGDLGNITANAQGVATIRIRDRVIRLSGAHSIIGRSLVVHAGADKFTQPSGDSGARVAFGVIGITK